MQGIRSRALMVALVSLGLALAFLALLYAVGLVHFFSRDPSSPHHVQHATVLSVLSAASVLGASMVRPKRR